jgi:hypothetical protein
MTRITIAGLAMAGLLVVPACGSDEDDPAVSVPPVVETALRGEPTLPDDTMASTPDTALRGDPTLPDDTMSSTPDTALRGTDSTP